MSVEYSIGISPVGDIKIDYLRDPVDRGQSTDAAPLTELLVFYTLIHLYTAIQCGKTLVLKNFHGVVSVFRVCQTMNGAALGDDRSSVTFDVELCIPWDTPDAVVDMNSAEVVMLGQKINTHGSRRRAHHFSRPHQLFFLFKKKIQKKNQKKNQFFFSKQKVFIYIKNPV